jgi:hypothetical protein
MVKEPQRKVSIDGALCTSNQSLIFKKVSDSCCGAHDRPTKCFPVPSIPLALDLLGPLVIKIIVSRSNGPRSFRLVGAGDGGEVVLERGGRFADDLKVLLLQDHPVVSSLLFFSAKRYSANATAVWKAEAEVGRITYIEDTSNDIVRATKRSTALAAGEVFNQIQKWIRATDSWMLWVEGTANFSPVSDVFIAAAHIRAIVRQADIPCVAFFCRILRRDSTKIDPSRTRQSDGLVGLMFSLIRQLASLAPSSIQDKEQCHSRFPLLDGKIGSMPVALDIIKGLLEMAPSLLVCSIDGIELLDHKGTNPYVKELIGIVRVQDPERAVKVLLITSGLVFHFT